jgi:hypothetical protein
MRSNAQSSWPRREHGELRQLSDNLWIVEGPVPGTLYRRQMIVARDQRRRLLLHSVIALDTPRMAALDALGVPTWLFVPNGYHRLDAPAYKQRYPQLQVVTPAGSLRRVHKVVAVDSTYAQFESQVESTEALQVEQAPWPDAAEGVVRVHSADGVSLVFNDLLWTPPEHGWSARMNRWLGQGPQVPWLARRMFARQPALLRAWLERLAHTPELVRVIPGHGAPITHAASAVLLRVAQAVG